MNDLVIIPTFDRPEFLWACLENLYRNVRGALTNKLYWITEDIHADKPKDFTTQWENMATLREAVRMFGSSFRYLATQPHTTYGNSYNVLSALAEAAISEVNKVYLIEDDVLVTPDFFEWHEGVHRTFSPWASCAGRLNRSLNFHMNGPEAIDENIKDLNACHESKTAYISWATCFSRIAIENIAGTANSFEYFRPGYEQDIMIQDHIRRHKLTTVWPYVPRAYHMGWYSYHRTGGMKLYGTLEEKVKALQAAVTKPAKLRSLAGATEIDAFPASFDESAMELYLL